MRAQCNEVIDIKFDDKTMYINVVMDDGSPKSTFTDISHDDLVEMKKVIDEFKENRSVEKNTKDVSFGLFAISMCTLPIMGVCQFYRIAIGKTGLIGNMRIENFNKFYKELVYRVVLREKIKTKGVK